MYKIAGVVVDMNPKYPRVTKQSEAYKTDDTKPDIRIAMPEEFLSERQRENPHLSLDECEYIWTGSSFYNALPEFGGFLLHSSAVVYENKAYLFTAPSGTGKSTHTQLWLKNFEGSYILNDDKPAIKLEDGKVMAYGTPFSGKTDWNVNKCVPLQAICILGRGEKNEIEKVPPEEALFVILDQTCRPYDADKMDKLLTILDKVISEVPVYRLRCNMSDEAAFVSYNAMKG